MHKKRPCGTRLTMQHVEKWNVAKQELEKAKSTAAELKEHLDGLEAQAKDVNGSADVGQESGTKHDENGEPHNAVETSGNGENGEKASEKSVAQESGAPGLRVGGKHAGMVEDDSDKSGPVREAHNAVETSGDGENGEKASEKFIAQESGAPGLQVGGEHAGVVEGDKFEGPVTASEKNVDQESGAPGLGGEHEEGDRPGPVTASEKKWIRRAVPLGSEASMEVTGRGR